MSSPYRILLVDDLVRYHAVYERTIKEATNAEVSFAANGEEALTALSGPDCYDLLVLDLRMPKLGGEETLRRIRQNPNLDRLPVIVLTGDSDQATHSRLLDLGADDFIAKGVPPEIFVARLKSQLRHRTTLDRLTRLAVDMDIFAAGVLHDIRNLEANILAVSDITRSDLETDPLGNQSQMLQYIAALDAKAHQLNHYATDIIRMVRETTKGIELKPTPVLPLIEWAVQVAAPPAEQVLPLLTIAGRGNSPHSPKLEPVVADRSFLQLAILNIVQNAVKYRRPTATPQITIRQRYGERVTSSRPVQSIITTFEDNGRGVEPSQLRRIFEPFVRTGDSIKNDTDFGLGLALVSKVMTSMHGRVWAELPSTGPGLIINLELPACNSEDPQQSLQRDQLCDSPSH